MNRTTTLAIGLILWAGFTHQSCNPVAIDADPVPAGLLARPNPDLTITLTQKVDFSIVNADGKGPANSLIRWELANSPDKSYTAYTYDEKGRPIGVYNRLGSYGYSSLTLSRYEGNYVKETCISLNGFTGSLAPKFPEELVRHTYGLDKKLRQSLIYSNVNWASEAGNYKLMSIKEYDYDAGGQLAVIRLLSPERDMWLQSFFSNGDIVKTETYYRPTDATAYTTIVTQEFMYEQTVDPRKSIRIDPKTSFVGTHFLKSQRSYSVSKKAGFDDIKTVPYQHDKVYDYSFDAANRLTQSTEQTRDASASSPAPATYKYTYAP